MLLCLCLNSLPSEKVKENQKDYKVAPLYGKTKRAYVLGLCCLGCVIIPQLGVAGDTGLEVPVYISVEYILMIKGFSTGA